MEQSISNNGKPKEHNYIEDLIDSGNLNLHKALKLNHYNYDHLNRKVVRILKIKKLNNLFYRFILKVSTLLSENDSDSIINNYYIHGTYSHDSNKHKRILYLFEYYTNYHNLWVFFKNKYGTTSNPSKRVKDMNLYINTNIDSIKDDPVHISITPHLYNSYEIVYNDSFYKIKYIYIWLPGHNELYLEERHGSRLREPNVILFYFHSKPKIL